MTYNRITKHFKVNAEKWLISLLTGIFMFFVLYVYKGYDIDQQISYSGHGLLFRALTYGLSTSAIFFVFEFQIKPKFKPEGLLGQILWHATEIFAGINVTFLLFNYFWSWTEFYWSSYSLFLFEYPLVVIFPIIIAKLAGSRFSTKFEGHIVFRSDNGKSSFSIKPDQFLYIKASDNYVDIFHEVNGTIKKHLLRCTLKNIEQQLLPNPYLLRCHRSFIINPKKVERISQGKTKTLHIRTENIPVSQKYEYRFN